MKIMGIDPGKTGAIAIIEDGRIIHVDQFNCKTTLFRKTEYEQIMNALSFKPDSIIIEDLMVLSRQKGMQTSATNHGFIQCVLVGNDYQFDIVKPNEWKRTLGLSSDKQESFDMANKLFPDASPYLTLKKHHDRAEAILLAYYFMHTIHSRQ